MAIPARICEIKNESVSQKIIARKQSYKIRGNLHNLADLYIPNLSSFQRLPDDMSASQRDYVHHY